MNSAELLFFSIFLILILCFLLLDLGVFDKTNHLVSLMEALFYTGLWIAVSLGFYVLLIFHGDWIHLGAEGNLTDLKALIVRYGILLKLMDSTTAAQLKYIKRIWRLNSSPDT